MSWDLHSFFIPVYGARIGLSASRIGMILAAFAAAADPPVDSIIDNGSLVQLGIHPEGHLNVAGGTPSFQAGTTDVGVRFIPTKS